METLHFDLSKSGKKFKPLNATNGGPWHKRHVQTLYRTNFEDYKAARIPYARNHDCVLSGIYGGPYSHDMSRIFPNFDADPDDPASYDFACTDECLQIWLEAGSKPFFRLGESAESLIKKRHNIPPADFQKWAVICEHIIRHYNEGWADGFHMDIEYWEIWNEPDLHEGYPSKGFWAGTREQFFDFYATAATHLKKCFPHIKIGGPSIAHNTEWAENFFSEMQKRSVPIDFFSWHIYCVDPSRMIKRADTVRALLDKYGYTECESIANEWNYVGYWGEGFVDSVMTIHGIKGATFIMACICEAQQNPIDMLMYYDTRFSPFNGVFDFYSYGRLKGYYALYYYGMFYDMEKEIASEERLDGIYSLCGVDKNGKTLTLITYYTDDNEAENRQISIDFGRAGNYEIYLLDETHDGELIETKDSLTFDMKLYSAILIKEV